MELTKNDIIKVIELIRVNYDNAYAGLSTDETKLLIDFWYDSLKKYPKEIVFDCVKNAINSCGYAPRLANVIMELRRIQEINSPTNEQLWAELSDVLNKVYQVSRYLSYPQYSQWTDTELNKIFDGLSDELKLFVVNRSTLVDISEMTEESLQYERARFFKQMPTLRQHFYDSLEAKELLLLTNSDNKLKQLENKKHN